ncbi:putative tRNA pseudouridine synthase, partial [Gigaspora margarita]
MNTLTSIGVDKGIGADKVIEVDNGIGADNGIEVNNSIGADKCIGVDNGIEIDYTELNINSYGANQDTTTLANHMDNENPCE